MLAKTPEPRYYSVIFTSGKIDVTAEREAYDIMASQMLELAVKKPSYLGV